MVVVGIMVRVEAGASARVVSVVQSLDGVSTLSLEAPDAFGAVLRASSVEAAEERLRAEIETLDGVLCAWPVHVEYESTASRPAEHAATPNDA